MNKKDLENETIKELIRETKKTIEREILKCFDCNISILNGGKVKDEQYLINICYIVKANEYKFPVGYCVTTNIGISEKDYNKLINK